MKKILIIEDNYEIRDNTAELLDLAGYSVITAKDGLEGIKASTEHLPELILCDIMMPGVDGYEVLRHIRTNTLTDKINFVFVTASVEQKEMKAAMDLGADGYLRKPFEENDLLALVKKFLEK